MAALEVGLRPVGSRALGRVEQAPDQLKTEALAERRRPEPDVGTSSHRGDTSGPAAA